MVAFGRVSRLWRTMMTIGIRGACCGVRSQANRELRASGMVSQSELLPSTASSSWLVAAAFMLKILPPVLLSISTKQIS
jgi:hypothetical protein